MAETVARLTPQPQLDDLRRQLEGGRFRRIVLTGMGGSYHILYPLQVRLTQAGFDSIMLETSELLHAMPRLLEPTNMVIAVSQSGASVETVRMLERAAGRAFVAGVTNTEDSPLAREAGLVLFTFAGEEKAVACKTSLTAMAVLYWIGEHLTGGDLTVARSELETLAPALEAYLARWQDHVRELWPRLDGVRHFFAVGRGSSLAAAGLGGLILKEAAHIHGEGMSSAGLRHGPLEMLGPETFVLVFDGDSEVSHMNRSLLRDIVEAAGRAALCGWEGEEGPFALPSVPASMRPVMEVLPVQMISLVRLPPASSSPLRLREMPKVIRLVSPQPW